MALLLPFEKYHVEILSTILQLSSEFRLVPYKRVGFMGQRGPRGSGAEQRGLAWRFSAWPPRFSARSPG